LALNTTLFTYLWLPSTGRRPQCTVNNRTVVQLPLVPSRPPLADVRGLTFAVHSG